VATDRALLAGHRHDAVRGVASDDGSAAKPNTDGTPAARQLLSSSSVALLSLKQVIAVYFLACWKQDLDGFAADLMMT